MSQFLKDYQFYIVTTIQLALTAIGFLWSRTIASKADVDKVQRNVEGVGTRVSQLEQVQRTSPDHEDISALKIEMERTRGEIKAFTAQLRGTRETMSVQVAAVKESSDRVESTARLLLEHALEQGKK